MIFTSISKLSFLILIYLNCKIVLANNAYEYFRILFDDQTVLKPRDIDLITNQLMENVLRYFINLKLFHQYFYFK